MTTRQTFKTPDASGGIRIDSPDSFPFVRQAQIAAAHA
jgi:hypothetical protein